MSQPNRINIFTWLQTQGHRRDRDTVDTGTQQTQGHCRQLCLHKSYHYDSATPPFCFVSSQTGPNGTGKKIGPSGWTIYKET
eukprot:654827-Pelagomonas_calceolata.AAC.5